MSRLIDADIVVVGGGMAGFSAAMAAAAEHKKVMLIERTDRLGGNATNSNVGTICGAYYRTYSEIPKPVGYAFCKDFISSLLSVSDKNKLINYHNGLFIVAYDWLWLTEYLDNQLNKAGVQVLKQADLVEVKKEGNYISNLSIHHQNKLIDLSLKSIIDCSGNGVVSQLADEELISSALYQSASQVFRVGGIQSENEFSLNMAIKKAMMQLIAVHHWPDSFSSLSIVPGSLRNNQADFKLTLPQAITDSNILKQQLAFTAKEYIEELFPLLSIAVSSLQNATVEFIYPEVGIRIQQRAKGKKILTEEDVLTCKKVSDGIAIGTWPMEEWSADGKLNMQYFEPDNGYFISADCLQSSRIQNLFFAGKNISATTKAIASARVIGTCLQTGFAAGKLSVCKDEPEKEKVILSLHQQLLTGNE